MIDAVGQPFYGAKEDTVLFETLKNNITNEFVDIRILDNNINDTEFALSAAKRLIELINLKG